MGYIRNTVRIQAPIDDVFRLTNNIRTWPDLFTEYAEAEVIEESKDSVTFRLTTHPDETGIQWSWVATRKTDPVRRSTYSEREPSDGPFKRMIIRWWYDSLGEADTLMTWEQEFLMKPETSFTEEEAIQYLNKQTHIQQQVIKERIEQQFASSAESEQLYRGVIIAQYKPGSEEQIVEAFRRSDVTDLPGSIGVKSRHVWVQGNIYVHFVEGQRSLPLSSKSTPNIPSFKR